MNPSKTALICGATGQDGAYLAQLLLEKGYRVVGTSRDAATANHRGLQALGVDDRIELVSMRTSDFRSILRALSQTEPDEVYNLSGQSSVGLSFEQPVETMESISVATVNLLEAIHYLNPKIRFYNASSSECFGEMEPGSAATEETAFRPRSPYAVAKSAAHWAVRNYREAYGLFAVNGVLFNHESPLRGDRFVTSKIVSAAVRIAIGGGETLQLHNLQIARDWGWAPEYVDAMWRMLQIGEASDFVIATGQSFTLMEFVEAAFQEVGLNWSDHVQVVSQEARPLDIAFNRGDPAKAGAGLGWHARLAMPQVVKLMVESRRSAEGPPGPRA